MLLGPAAKDEVSPIQDRKRSENLRQAHHS
jgi:hypothetical protein